MNKVRFTREEAERIRNQYFFEQKPNGKRYSMRDLSKEHKCGENVIYDVIRRVGVYKPEPEVLNTMMMTATEAMALFVNQYPRLPHSNQESYATTMVSGVLLRIRKSKSKGSDGQSLYQVDTVRRTYEKETKTRDK